MDPSRDAVLGIVMSCVAMVVCMTHSHRLQAPVPYSTTLECGPVLRTTRAMTSCRWSAHGWWWTPHVDLSSWRSHGGNQHSTWTLRDPVLVVVVTQHPAGLP